MTLLVPGGEPTLNPSDFFKELRNRAVVGERLVTFYGRPALDPAALALTVVLELDGHLRALRTLVPRAAGFHSLTRDLPAFHVFEREIFEEHGVRPHDHPWLKPLRFSGENGGRVAEYPFYRLEGKEVHEVGVGPIHAGVIEPGHFRFMCLGETVHHLEIQLGYQHRGVEMLLLQGDPRSKTPLVETISGDTSVAHAWAYCAAIEALAGVTLPESADASRGIALELERIAMHLAGLAGLATDVAFLPGSSTYGRLRTTAINTSMLICGSRFGRGWLRPGGVRGAIDGDVAPTVKANLALLKRDLVDVNTLFQDARSVQSRLQGVGVVTADQARSLGFVGLAARASGVAIDSRVRGIYVKSPMNGVVEPSGDCWARAVVRIREIDESLRWIDAVLAATPMLPSARVDVPALAPNMLAISVREGWRGEVVHCVETDSTGALMHYKVQDPSLRNWFALALALRENDISDFPICNKSFDLSYCGNDL